MRAPQALPGEPCPPGSQAFDLRAPTVIAENISMFHTDMPLRWIAQDGHFHELAADRTVLDLGAAAAFKSPVWDDRYWYRLRCYQHCVVDADQGTPKAIERIDRVTGAAVRLGEGDYGISAFLPFGDYIYWGLYGHSREGGMFRVPRSGGAQESLTLTRDKIQELHAYGDGVLVEATAMVGWIPAAGAPKRILDHLDNVGAATRDEGTFYIAERGDGYWGSKDSGYIHRVRDGNDVKLAGPVRWPSAIAAYGPNVYFMLSQSGDIWSVPKTGGTAKLLVAGPRIEPCDASLALWADARGLFWLRGWKFLAPRGDRLYFLPWSAL